MTVEVNDALAFATPIARQDKRATAVEGNPKAPFSLASTVTYGINRNSRKGGAPLLSHCVHNFVSQLCSVGLSSSVYCMIG